MFRTMLASMFVFCAAAAAAETHTECLDRIRVTCEAQVLKESGCSTKEESSRCAEATKPCDANAIAACATLQMSPHVDN